MSLWKPVVLGLAFFSFVSPPRADDLTFPLKVGMVGKFTKKNVEFFEVKLVLDAQEMIVSPMSSPTVKGGRVKKVLAPNAGPADAYIWVKGFPTAGIKNNEEIQLEGIFKVSGTKTYQTASGNKTVFVLEPESPEERASRLKEMKAKEEEAAKVKAREAEKQAKIEAERRAQAEAEAKAAASKKAEQQATASLKLAKNWLDESRAATSPELKEKYRDRYLSRLRELVKKYPNTKAAREAQKLLGESGQ